MKLVDVNRPFTFGVHEEEVMKDRLSYKLTYITKASFTERQIIASTPLLLSSSAKAT